MARKKVLGLPVGKRKRSVPSFGKLAGAAAALAAPAVAIPAARRVAPAARKATGAAKKGEELVGEGTKAVKTAGAVKDAVASQSSTVGKVGAAIKALSGGGEGGGKPKLSHLIEQHVDIGVPRSVAYNQWTQLEMFPKIVKGIESVSQDEDDKTSWTSKIGPSRRNWTGKIVEQVPDERIAWKQEGGTSAQGVVTFHSLTDDLTRVLVEIEYKPTGAVEWVGNTLRVQRRRAKRDLRLFQHFIELRGEETGGWRGAIDKKEGLEPKEAGQGGGKKQGKPNGSRGASGSDSKGSRSRASGSTAKRSDRAVAASARPRRSTTTASAKASSPRPPRSTTSAKSAGGGRGAASKSAGTRKSAAGGASGKGSGGATRSGGAGRAARSGSK